MANMPPQKNKTNLDSNDSSKSNSISPKVSAHHTNKVHRQEGYFRGHNDYELFYQSWLQEDAKGSIIVTHGLGEHSECYHRLAEGIKAAGYNIYAWDLRGHGRSEGKRGVVKSFLDYAEDLAVFKSHLESIKVPGPVYLLGHSMGGLVTVRTLLHKGREGIKGLILSSPLMGIAVEIPKIKSVGGNILASWLPELTLNNEIKYSQLTHDRDVINEYEHDPLRHDMISTKLFVEMQETMRFCLDHAVQIELPLLHMQAGLDTVVSVERSRDFYNKVSSKDKEFHLYEGFYHESFNESGRERPFSDIVNWLKFQSNK
jgi:alpha-beta hydrolase superfamily lysophospholipase